MMAEKKRQCGTCRFFLEKEASGHGKCTHPKRAGTDADLLLLRPTELACRTKWGDSLWQDPEDDSDPMHPQLPQQPSLPEPIAAQLQFDDEVTSVSIAGSKSSRPSYEDDVVDSGATATGMASWNDPVQDERLDLLRKGNHDAVAGARKRHMEKQTRQRELIPFADDNEIIPSEPTSANQSNPEADKEQPLSPNTERRSIFPPEDFVENEKSAATDDPAIDDEMVDEGVSPEHHRSPRLRKLLREPNNPKKNEAMRISMPSEMRVTSNNPDNREQWNTVPTLNPAFDLSLSKPQSTNAPSDKLAAHAAPTISSSYQPRPISQAKELKTENRIRTERAQRSMVAPIMDTEPQKPQPTPPQFEIGRPRLSEATARTAPPIDRWKNSPLRGYQREAALASRQESTRQQQAQQPQEAPTQRHANPEQPQPHRYDARPEFRTSAQPQSRPQSQQMQRAENRATTNTKSQHRAEPQPRSYVELHDMSVPFEREEIEISPNVPRRCGTCASFKPGSVNGRGSCTNQFAGPAQRVVYKDDLACQHTYGSLWIPADEEVWLEEQNTNYPPTPLVDAMLARRRRRENPVLPDLDELTS